MSDLKIVLLNPRRPKADGTCPIAIRVTVNRKQLYTSIGKYVKPDEWDEDAQRVRKNHANSKQLNNFILKKLSEANQTLISLETEQSHLTAATAKHSIRPKTGIAFFKNAEDYTEDLKKQGKYSHFKAELSRLKTFREFLKSADVSFPDITVGVLNKFETWLKEPRERKTGKDKSVVRKLSERSVVNHLMTIRSVFSHAIKQNPALKKHYPFGGEGVSIKFPDTLKIGLTTQEVKRIEELELAPLSPIDHARNIWLMSFYFAGVRNGDILLLRWTDFHDGRLHYVMGKNKKAGSVKLGEKALQVLEKYESLKDGTGLVFTKLRDVKDWSDGFAIARKIAFVNRSLNKTLKLIARRAGVEKNLAMHISRHSFGNIAGDKVPIPVLRDLYRHSSIVTTVRYQSSFIHEASDKAVDDVTNF